MNWKASPSRIRRRERRAEAARNCFENQKNIENVEGFTLEAEATDVSESVVTEEVVAEDLNEKAVNPEDDIVIDIVSEKIVASEDGKTESVEVNTKFG